jgi:hypothetical protein
MPRKITEYDKNYYKNNKEKARETQKAYYHKNKEKIKEQRKIQRNKPENKAVAKQYAISYRIKKREALKNYKKDWYRSSELRFKRYGITKENYQKMVIEQKNKCLICEEEKPLVIDHCHNSNKVRGLLCHSCNKGLGCFYDNIKSLKKAIQYVSTT